MVKNGCKGVAEMKAIVIFYDFMGKEVDRVVSDWPHYKIDDKILYRDVEYAVRGTLIDLDDMNFYIRAYTSQRLGSDGEWPK